MVTGNFGIVFREEGLDKDAMRKELSSMVKISGETDGTIEDIHGNEVPLYVFMIDGLWVDFMKLKIKYNCDQNGWYLFPRDL